jgi:hypothetical protein
MFSVAPCQASGGANNQLEELWQRREWACDAVAKTSAVALKNQIPSTNPHLPAGARKKRRHDLCVGDFYVSPRFVACGADPTLMPDHIDAVFTAKLLTKPDKMVT